MSKTRSRFRLGPQAGIRGNQSVDTLSDVTMGALTLAFGTPPRRLSGQTTGGSK